MGWAALLSLLRGGGPRSRSRGPGHTAAAVTVHRLRRAASTVGGLCCSVWDLPESGTEPTSPALADRLLTTEPPGKPSTITFFKSKLPTSSLPLFQDKLLQTSAAHTHAFPHSGQHSVGTWILNRYCTFPYSFLALKKNKKKTFPACFSTSGVWNEMRASQCWVCEGSENFVLLMERLS